MQRSVQSLSNNVQLLVAIDHGRRDRVKALLAANADLAAQTAQGYTPLHLAAKKGNHDILADLLEAKADPAAQTIMDKRRFIMRVEKLMEKL